MSQIGKIKLRNIVELTVDSCDLFESKETIPEVDIGESSASPKLENEPETPAATPIKKERRKRAATTSKKQTLDEGDETKKLNATNTVVGINATTRKSLKTLRILPGQQSIDKYFKSGVKSYKIDPEPPSTAIKLTPNKSKNTRKARGRTPRGRKRLFKERADGSASSTTTATSVSMSGQMTPPRSRKKTRAQKRPGRSSTSATKAGGRGETLVKSSADVIVILSSDDEDAFQPQAQVKPTGQAQRQRRKPSKVDKSENTTGTNSKSSNRKSSDSSHVPSTTASGVKKRSASQIPPAAVDVEACSASSHVPPTASEVEEPSASSYIPATASDVARPGTVKTNTTSTNVPPTASEVGERSASSYIPPTASDVEKPSTVKTITALSNVPPTPSEVEERSASSYIPPTASDVARPSTVKTSTASVTRKQLLSETRFMVSIPVRKAEAKPTTIKPPASPSGSDKSCEFIDEVPFGMSLPTPPLSSASATKPLLRAASTSTVVHDAIATEAPTSSSGDGKVVRKRRPCPAYKVVAGTTFAVDAFQYGQITGVTHYFLTHYHADHYVGLTRKFAMPLYLSPITARLVRTFIPLENKYIHEIDLNRTEKIAGIEVTAIDANHCPGAVMFVFKLPSGKCILHTGDFRACPEMESEPIFWNNTIDSIYLDTTYISNKYNFCSQHESIDRAKHIVEQFLEQRAPARILLVCGAYVIGKEKFWCELAQKFEFRVWTEKNRDAALRAMDLVEMRNLLCDNPRQAQLHVISIMKLNYPTLVEYFKPYERDYDALLAIRPSGWEKNSRPQLRGRINIVGIEYSEHSSHSELERFVTYLKPSEVISTVPVSNNPMITAAIPKRWYQYGTLRGRKRNFQASITSYIKLRPPVGGCSKRKTTNCISPTKSHNGINYSQNQSLLSMQPMETCYEDVENCLQQLACVTPPKRILADVGNANVMEAADKTEIEVVEQPRKQIAEAAAEVDAVSTDRVLNSFAEAFPQDLDVDADAIDDWMF